MRPVAGGGDVLHEGDHIVVAAGFHVIGGFGSCEEPVLGLVIGGLSHGRSEGGDRHGERTGEEGDGEDGSDERFCALHRDSWIGTRVKINEV